MVMACPLIEVVDRLPDTGSNTVKSVLAIALLPFLNANDPDAFTVRVTVSATPVHGTPGKVLVKDPLPCASLWPLTWVTLASPNATFKAGSHMNVSVTETDAPRGPSVALLMDKGGVVADADAGDDTRASASAGPPIPT